MMSVTIRFRSASRRHDGLLAKKADLMNHRVGGHIAEVAVGCGVADLVGVCLGYLLRLQVA